MPFRYIRIRNFTIPLNDEGTKTKTLKTAYGIDTPHRELDFMRLVAYRSSVNGKHWQVSEFSTGRVISTEARSIDRDVAVRKCLDYLMKIPAEAREKCIQSCIESHDKFNKATDWKHQNCTRP